MLTGTYRLNTVIDLRTETERERKPDPVLTGVKDLRIPIFEEATGGITREDDDPAQFVLPNMGELYRTTTTDEDCRQAR